MAVCFGSFCLIVWFFFYFGLFFSFFLFFFFFFFFEQGENNAWLWIGEKPAPLTCLKAGSYQPDRTCLPVSGEPGQSPCLECPQPLAQLPTAAPISPTAPLHQALG